MPLSILIYAQTRPLHS
jgi:hypothetical protein